MKRDEILKRLGFGIPHASRIRVIVCSDLKNEADDQYAVIHHLLSPSEEICGIVACHFEWFSRRVQQQTPIGEQWPFVKEDAEITVEVNPGTVDKQKLEDYIRFGINRLSIGLQSANNELLKEIGRIHTFEQFLTTYNLAREVGFENINVDLMIGLPKQRVEDIKNTLNKVIKLNPTHISVYSLIVEEGTRIEELLNSNKLKLPDEELERQMYWYVKNTLELNGYNHYEISNFSKQEKKSKHNMNCWEQKEYIGLGCAAYSYLNDIRYGNTNNIEKYLDVQDFKNKEELEKNKIRIIDEVQSLEDKEKEYMLLGLRKIEGVSIQRFKEKYVQNPIFSFKEELEKLVNEELLVIDGDYIRLTNKGLDLANIVWEEFV